MGDQTSDIKSQKPTENRFLTAQEVTGMLQISLVTLRAWTSQKKIPYYKVGRSVRFNLIKLQEWLNEREVKSRR